MTRAKAYEAYYHAFGRQSMCNGHEVDAILEEYDDEELVLDAMQLRNGTPSPRGKTTFLNLPRSRTDELQSEFNVISTMPDVKDEKALKRWILLRYRLHEDQDKWLVNAFVERFRKLEAATSKGGANASRLS